MTAFDTDPADFGHTSKRDKPRIVVKVGSSLLANTPDLRPRYAFMHGLLSDIAQLRDQGFEVVLASSGSVALGLKALNSDSERASIQEKQAAAACGQPVLLNAYKQIALEHGFDIAQVLVTLDDLENRRRFLNTKNTVHKLLELGVLPIVNENDTITTEEIRVGDNDRLAAKVAQMIQAQLLVILTSVDGLYDRNPDEEGAQLIDKVDDVSEYLAVTSGTNSLGTGGMFTKMQAANMAQNAGCETIISRGIIDNPITSALENKRPHTRCVAKSTPQSAWAVWLTDRLQMAGSLVLSQSAADALEKNDGGVFCSDLISIHQAFHKADVLHIYDEHGVERARGLSNFSSDEAALIASNPNREIRDLLGYQAEMTLVNRQNLVILEDHHLPWDEPEERLRVIAA
ncbi:MAG: glutamate 5-kinase [Glaciecola sp.]|jgi:glutamate 5-kinase|uniref:glutamate 5-kinase n=1 Tax=Congregibacter sp. TaxID=2744308 RepID=UPI0039E6A620